MTKRTAWVIVGAVLTAIILSACAGIDLAKCGPGMTLRNQGEGYYCEGFGTGFNWKTTTPKSMIAIRGY